MTPEQHSCEYPEHDRLALVQDRSQAVGEFLEWLPSQDLHLATWGCQDDDHGEDEHECPQNTLHPSYLSIKAILARYFDVDLRRLEDEKEQMLAAIRERATT